MQKYKYINSEKNNISGGYMEKQLFKKELSFSKVFIFFLIGCVFGTYYEQVLHLITNCEWSSRRGLLFGPFNPIYGIPAVILLLFLAKENDKRGIIKTYIYSAIISGVAEYIIGCVLEYGFRVKFWDYTGYFLNIGGKTTLPFMLFWGVLGVLLLKVIYPIVSKWLEKVPYRVFQPAFTFALIFTIFNMTLTYSAFGRMAFRNSGKEPYTFIGEFCDQVFTNEYMTQKFPAMKINNSI